MGNQDHGTKERKMKRMEWTRGKLISPDQAKPKEATNKSSYSRKKRMNRGTYVRSRRDDGIE
ncbi:37586_t:CDS:2 [Gigaspora margarita]|uniref:37586_t:CDS:1 n=1 Tax=Gigaspora margarita TaxID=4874 RepID=A0ABN7UUQ2_GIGMA|nr:37586_t:CDS:2 [Gigaspora margarita]